MNYLSIQVACIGSLFFAVTVNAQTSGRYAKTNNNMGNVNQALNPTPVVTQRKNLSDIENTRKTMNSDELSRLPVRDINAIANTVTGVQSYGGGTPNIKGAPASGTAYFVDGVRVHGAIPNSIK